MNTIALTLTLALTSAAARAAGAPELPALPAVLETIHAGAGAIPTPVGVAVVQGPPSAAPVLPASFNIYGRFFAWTHTFDVYALDDKTVLGTTTERFLALTKTFTYVDGSKNKIAEARARFWALGSTVDVVDGQGRAIGTIKEDILKSLFKVYTLYHILDASGREIANSEKVEWLSTEIVLRDPSGRAVATVRRDFRQNLFRLTDKWNVSVQDPSVVDSRLIVMIATYKSSVDADRRAQDAANSISDSSNN